MATSVNTSVPMWLTGCTYDANGGDDLRNSGVTALTYPAGPASGSSAGVLVGVLGTGLGVTTASGMNVHVGGGSFIVSNPTASGGGYTATLASQASLTVASADPVNPRVDLVCCTVVDNGNSSSYGMVQVVTGTPASSPVPPATPASSARLALVSVPALATSVVSGDIQDVRSYTCAVGGIVTQEIAFAPPGYNGCYGYDLPSDRLYHNSATTIRQARVLPLAPVHQLIAGGVLIGSSGLDSVASASCTLDGQTDIKVTANITQINQTSGGTLSGSYPLQAEITVDSVGVGETVTCVSFTGSLAGGCQVTAYTSAASGNTPSAGAHTISLNVGFTGSAGLGSSAFKTGGSFGYLRVEPVTL